MTTTPRNLVVLFGGSGFIGGHLARHLLAEGRDVVIADIVPPRTDIAGVRFVYCDVRKRIELHEGALCAMNLAAVHRTPGHAENEYYETNVAGALNVTQWAAQQGVQRLVFTSSISVYGPSDEWKSETSRPSPNSAYGHSKLLAEQIHEAWQKEEAVRHLTIVRPAVVFGPGENGNFTRLATALKRKRFVLPGRDDTIKSCGYVGDLVRAIMFMEGRGTSTFNYCYPETISIKDVCDAFHDVAGFEHPRTVPGHLIRPLLAASGVLPGRSRLRELSTRISKLTSSTAIRPAVLEGEGFTWDTDLASALKDWSHVTQGEFN